jgi:uncharacterized protein YfdQ (DUF2303 family)
MENENQPNIVETAIQAGKALALDMDMKYENGMPYILRPENYTVQFFPELRECPTRIEQKTAHTTAQSFVDYFNRHQTDFSVIFIDEENASFTAILDYHFTDTPGWKKHVSKFTPAKTPEWQSWLANDKKVMSQEDFGRFIENNIAEIQTPSGAEMLEIALSIQAKTEVKFSRATRLDNGQLQIGYNEVTNGTAGINGQLKIPEKFTIGLRLFRGVAPYKIDARLRYRIKEGNLSLWYELIRPHAVIDANIAEITETITAGIAPNTPIYRGASD